MQADCEGSDATMPMPSCAPAGRASASELQRDVALLQHFPLLQAAIDAMATWVVILNDKRQIVGANRAVMNVLSATMCDIVGKRPGEAVQCLHSIEGADGCGTGVHCLTCGAVKAIMESWQSGDRVTRECRVLLATGPGAALDLRVTATPIDVYHHRFLVFSIEEISEQKRLTVLSRTFFHDVLNTAGCLQGYLQWLADSPDDPVETGKIIDRLKALSGQLVEQVESYRDLSSAERGELRPQWQIIRTDTLLETLRSRYLGHQAAQERTIRLADVWQGSIVTDRQLLSRVLDSMLKNALEATPPGGTVTLRCLEKNCDVVFSVHNATVIPDHVQLQIFHRSFSTKAEAGHGIGAHSMKLLGERYLGGKVSFVSAGPEGTTFSITLPKEPAMEEASGQAGST